MRPNPQHLHALFVLQHGWTHRLHRWERAGSGDALHITSHRLLVDARGQGARANPHAPAASALSVAALSPVAVEKSRVALAHGHGQPE
jgi:hypothetical protein